MPFITLNTRPNGQVKPCSQVMNMTPIKKNTTVENLIESPNPHYNLTKDSLEEIWNSKFMQDFRMKKIRGEYIKFCETCYQQEENKIQSKRQTALKHYYDDNEHLIDEALKNNGIMTTMPVWWELRLSSICNEACRMCIPQTSSKMREEFSKFSNELPATFRKNTETAILNFNQFGYLGDNDFFIQQIYNNLENIKYLELHGGEPTNDKNLWNVVQHIVDTGHSGHIHIHVHTNIHALRRKHIDLWNQFKSGWIGVSIDAYGNENEYIRYGSDWTKIEENLKLLSHLGTHWDKFITSTVMVYNCCTMHRLAEWYINYTKNNNMTDLQWLCFPVTSPESMRPEHVPEGLRNNAVQLILDLKGTHTILTDNTIDSVVKILTSKYIPRLESYKELLAYTRILDQKRNQNIVEIFPHFKEVFND